MSIPYHLRPNKAVDRSLFMDLLRMLSGGLRLKDYTYIGMGGPFLGDFKELHSVTGITNMHSIESEEWIYQRQKLNKPLSCIQLHNMDSTQFINEEIEEILSEKNVIVWLDYVNSMLGEQMDDIAKLTAKLGDKDILKVSLSAAASQFNCINEFKIVHDPINGCQQQRLSEEDVLSLRRDKLALKTCIPGDLENKDLNNQNFPIALIKILRSTVESSIQDHLTVQPLGFYIYRDGVRMLTVTFIVLRKTTNLDEFLEANRLNEWLLSNLSWNDSPHVIEMPVVSPIEKFQIDSHYPRESSDPIPEFGFRLDEKIEKNEKIFKEYTKFYKYLPAYSKVDL